MKYNFFIILILTSLCWRCTKIEVLPENVNTNPYDKEYNKDVISFLKTKSYFNEEENKHYVTFYFEVREGEMEGVPKYIRWISKNYFTGKTNSSSLYYGNDIEFTFSEDKLVASGEFQTIDFYTYDKTTNKSLGNLGTHSILVEY